MSMNLLDQFQPHNSLFASPLGTWLTKGCTKRLNHACTDIGLNQAALDLFEAYPNAPVVIGALPFNTSKAAQLLVPESATYYPNYEYSSSTTTKASHPISSLKPTPPAKVFEAQVADALSALQNTPELTKLVMARHLDATLEAPLNRSVLLDALWQKNPLGYTYSMPLDDSADPETFLGASPELLLRRFGQTVFLNPLAGTALRDLNDPEADQQIAQTLLNSAKDLYEHSIVIKSIIDALSPYCEHLEAAATPHLVSTATLWHLSTEVTGQLKAPYASVLELALAVHPTPAVCGHPTLTARDVIEGIEGIDRKYFTGAIGWMDRNGDGEWAVAIRCAHYQNLQLRLSAGAGVVKSSIPESERIETGNKLRTLLNALYIDPDLIQQGITE